MAIIEALEEGVHGIVKVTMPGGSLFRFRRVYLQQSAEAGRLVDLAVGADLAEGLLERAAETQAAEDKAQSLLARAEQYRAGLERKLMAKKLSRTSIRTALDYLEERGLLSDERYARSWIRQRMRRHAEGPLSVKAALAAKGLAREALAMALEAEFADEHRLELLANARALLGGPVSDELRWALKKLGWKSAEIDELFEHN